MFAHSSPPLPAWAQRWPPRRNPRRFLKEQREIALFAENVRRKVFDRTVAVQKLGGGPGADPRDAGVTVGRIAHEGEQIRNELRADAELATLRTDAPLFTKVETLRWRGATPAFATWAKKMEAPRLLERCDRVKLRSMGAGVSDQTSTDAGLSGAKAGIK